MKSRERWVAPLASVSIPSVPPEFSEKAEKTQSPKRSTAFGDAKFSMWPEKPPGSIRSTALRPPAKSIVWFPETVEPNSRVEWPKTVSVPAPVTAPSRLSVPLVTAIAPVFSISGVIALVPDPADYSNRPAFKRYDAAELPRAIPLSSTMS